MAAFCLDRLCFGAKLPSSFTSQPCCANPTLKSFRTSWISGRHRSLNSSPLKVKAAAGEKEESEWKPPKRPIFEILKEEKEAFEKLRKWNEAHHKIFERKRKHARFTKRVFKRAVDEARHPESGEKAKVLELKKKFINETQEQWLSLAEYDTKFKRLEKEVLADLCREVVKFGELAQSTYDALRTKNVYSNNFGTSKFPADVDFVKASAKFLGEDAKKYKDFKALMVGWHGGRSLVTPPDESKRLDIDLSGLLELKAAGGIFAFLFIAQPHMPVTHEAAVALSTWADSLFSGLCEATDSLTQFMDPLFDLRYATLEEELLLNMTAAFRLFGELGLVTIVGVQLVYLFPEGSARS